MTLELWELGALVLAGTVGGMLNVMAGGGSIITVPVMIFLGVPGPVANGTNRIAILAQNVSAIATFRKLGRSYIKLSLSLTACAIPGAALGAWMGASLAGDTFNTVLALVMLIVLVLMFTGRSAPHSSADEPKNLLLGHLLMVLAGFWGGFIQIGVGFILMPILNRVMGLDLVATNVYKVFIAGGYTVVALLVFAINSDLLWLIGGVLAIGNSLGGYLGAKLTISRGEKLIRPVLALAIFAMVVRLLFFS